VSASTVQRIWRASGLQPHRLETSKLSTYPHLVAKVRDVVGLYVAPPERAIVLCVDEKSRIQALDRSSRPMFPMRPGQPARRSHDYKRHSATWRFTALDIATGRSSGSVTSAIALLSSASFSIRSKPLFQAIWIFTLSWTNTQPTTDLASWSEQMVSFRPRPVRQHLRCQFP